jgi:hypothetical protein
MIVGVQISSGNSAPNSGNNHHLTVPFEGGMQSFKRQGACVYRNWRYESESPNRHWNHHCWHPEQTRLSCRCLQNHKGYTYRAPVRYVTKTWSVVLLNKKKYIYCCLKSIAYDKLLKPRQPFWITLYIIHKHSDHKQQSNKNSTRYCVGTTNDNFISMKSSTWCTKCSSHLSTVRNI